MKDRDFYVYEKGERSWSDPPPPPPPPPPRPPPPPPPAPPRPPSRSQWSLGAQAGDGTVRKVFVYSIYPVVPPPFRPETSSRSPVSLRR